MPVEEILNEIDAYLSRLRDARKLLLDRGTGAPQKRVSRRKGKARVRQADPVSSSKSRADENKTVPKHSVTRLKKGTKRVDTDAQISSAATDHALDSEQPVIAQPERTMPQTIVVKKLPSKGPRSSIRSMGHRTPKPAALKPDGAKPAIALAGPMSTKIVVVPAEQVRQEREREAQPKVRRPHARASGLTGRLAFEALFE
jgi:hypothetical protein